MIYLASPYTDPDARVRAYRYSRCKDFAGLLMARAQFVYSPVVHCHPISQTAAGSGVTYDTWLNHCLLMIEKVATSFYILELPGWEKSVGVAKELVLAAELGLPIRYFEPQLYREAFHDQK